MDLRRNVFSEILRRYIDIHIGIGFRREGFVCSNPGEFLYTRVPFNARQRRERKIFSRTSPTISRGNEIEVQVCIEFLKLEFRKFLECFFPFLRNSSLENTGEYFQPDK